MPGLTVVKKELDEGAALIAQSDGVLAATVTLTIDLENAVASRPLPLTVDVQGQPSEELVRIFPKNHRRAWRYSWHSRWRPGGRSGSHDPSATYVLPYSVSARYVVRQSSFGDASHATGSGFENAIDWEMPIGTPILAARAGMVVAVRDDSALGGPSLEYQNCANYVVIRHGDGTFGSYMHLKPKGAMVKSGDHVKVRELARV